MRLQANKHREVQLARTGGRKLFDEAAQAEFLEWFAATGNVSWSAELAGFNYRTVFRWRMNDARFREGWGRALEQGYARLEAKRLETKRREAPIGIEGDRDAPEMDEMEPERIDRILAAHRREVRHPDTIRRKGRRPTVASNAEVKAALRKRLNAFYARERARTGKGEEAGKAFPGEGRGPAGDGSADELGPGLRRGTDGADARGAAALDRRGAGAPRDDEGGEAEGNPA